MRRRSIVALVLLTSMAACRGDVAPDTSPEAEAEVTALAIATVCEQLCIGTEVPVRDVVAEELVPPWEGPPLSDVQRQAYTQQFADIVFLDAAGAEEQIASGGVVLVAAPVVEVAPDELRVDMAAENAEGVRDFTQSFRWNGAEWVAID